MKRRNTQSKQEVLDTLRNAGAALSHDMVQAKLESLDRATIYRILNRFCADGLVHKILGQDGKQYFALCVNCQEEHRHNHFHFQCVQCGRVECLEEEVSTSLPKGYTAEQFYGLISGHCKRCEA